MKDPESVNPNLRKLLLDPYDKPIMNNTHRAHFVECLIAQALGSQWQLTWQKGWDWAAWDLEESESGVRLEVKQAAARQSWDDPTETPQRNPRFDIAPRKGYWTSEGSEWKDLPGRHADIYVFAWHKEARAESCDHRKAEQWVFYVVPEQALPANQKSIGLPALDKLLAPCRFGALKKAVRDASPSPKERKAFLENNFGLKEPAQ